MIRLGRILCNFGIAVAVVCLPCVLAQLPDVTFVEEDVDMCSCDCCEVAQRTPSEVAIRSDGQLIRHKCILHSAEGAHCPLFCTPDATRPSSDYSVFCLHSCRPSSEQAGMSCSLASAPDTLSMKPAPAGMVRSKMRGASPSASGQKGQSDQDRFRLAPHEAHKALANSRTSQKPEVVRWSMADIVTQRLRAEAGADMAHGAAVGERVRINQQVVGRNVEKMKRLGEAMASAGTGIGENVAVSSSSASAASDSSKKVAILLKAAKAMFSQELKDTQTQVANLVRQQAAAALQDEAAAYATRMEWEKPKDWNTILANRASVPYLREVALSSQRLSQYQSYANDLVAQAKDLKDQAASEAPQAAAAKAAGDTIDAVTKEDEVNKLLVRAQHLEAEAREYWATAQIIQAAIPQWQQAAGAAAAYASAKHRQYQAAVRAAP